MIHPDCSRSPGERAHGCVSFGEMQVPCVGDLTYPCWFSSLLQRQWHRTSFGHCAGISFCCVQRLSLKRVLQDWTCTAGLLAPGSCFVMAVVGCALMSERLCWGRNLQARHRWQLTPTFSIQKFLIGKNFDCETLVVWATMTPRCWSDQHTNLHELNYLQHLRSMLAIKSHHICIAACLHLC